MIENSEGGVCVGQIANQMAVELLCRLREKLRQRRKKKKKPG